MILRTLGLWAAAGAMAACAGSAMAQGSPEKEPRDHSVYFSDEQMKGIGDAIGNDPATGTLKGFSKHIIGASTYSTSLIRLVKGDTPHAHGTWSEIFVVRSGSGILETGGRITGITGHNSATHGDLFVDRQKPANTPPPPGAPARNNTPGDLAGTGIEGGTQQHVKAGDIVLVPAGVPHRWLSVDQPVIYLDIKFPKAD